MFQFLRKLKEIHGFIPDTIIDIGCNKGDWTKDCFFIYSPDQCKYILFDATDYNCKERFKHLPNVSVQTNILSDLDNKMVMWYSNTSTGDSIYREKTCHFKDTEPVIKQSTTLDTVLNGKTLGKVLLKIDTQGSELPILEGSMSTLNHVDFLVLEIPFFGSYNEKVPSFLEHIQRLDKLGFLPFEILENHHVKGFNIQVDMLFIKKNHDLLENLQCSLMSH
jgi:FkbM family methyltransferase